MRLVVERRPAPSRQALWVGQGLAVALAFLMGAVVFLLAGANPLAAYAVMADGAFGSLHNLSEVLVKAIPLMLCGLAVAVAARIQIWNIGGEGQLVLGGIGAAGVALFLSPLLPTTFVLPLMLAAGCLAGGLWALIPGFLRARLEVNEILTTLMLNYVAIFWLEHLYFGPWRDPMGMGFPGTAMFPDRTWLPRLPGTRIHFGLCFALLAAALLQWTLSHTRWGYETRVIGENPRAARYAGMDIGGHILWAMFLSGGLAGMAGMAEVAGIHYRLQQGLAVGYGYTGIIVAWLGRLRPHGTLFVAFCIAGLLVGGDQLQAVLHLPSSVGLVLEATLLFCVLGSDVLSRYRLRWQKQESWTPQA
jgi:simple sugar transport system permease protein